MATYFVREDRVLEVYALQDAPSFDYQARVRQGAADWPDGETGWNDVEGHLPIIRIPVGMGGGVWQVRIRVVFESGEVGDWCPDPEVVVPAQSFTEVAPVEGGADCPPEDELAEGRVRVDSRTGRSWLGGQSPWLLAEDATISGSVISYNGATVTLGDPLVWNPAENKANPRDWLIGIQGEAPGARNRDGVFLRSALGDAGEFPAGWLQWSQNIDLPDSVFAAGTTGGSFQQVQFNDSATDAPAGTLRFTFSANLAQAANAYRFVARATNKATGTTATASFAGASGSTAGVYEAAIPAGAFRTLLTGGTAGTPSNYTLTAAVLLIADYEGTDWDAALLGALENLAYVVPVRSENAERPYSFDVEGDPPAFTGVGLRVAELDQIDTRCFTATSLSGWRKIPSQAEALIYSPLPAGVTCPPATRGAFRTLWVTPSGEVFDKGLVPWLADIQPDIPATGAFGLLFRQEGLVKGVVTEDRARLQPAVGAPVRFLPRAVAERADVNLEAIDIRYARAPRVRMRLQPGRADLAVEVENDLAIAIRGEQTGDVVAVAQTVVDVSDPYDLPMTSVQEAALTAMIESNNTFSLLLMRTSVRCAEDLLNPWIPLESLGGPDREGVEFVYSLSGRAFLPDSEKPPRTTVYDAARSADGMDVGFSVGGRAWFDEEQQTGVTTPYLIVLWREVVGFPERGAVPTEDWSDWRGPIFRRQWASDGTRGEAGRDGRYVEHIYRQARASEVDVDPVTKVVTPKSELNPPTTSTANREKNDFVPDGFTDDPGEQPVSEEHKYEFQWRRRWLHDAEEWSEFQLPAALWATFGEDGITAFLNPATSILSGGRPLWEPLFHSPTGDGGAGRRATAVWQRADAVLCEVEVDFDVEGGGTGNLPSYVESVDAGTRDPPGRGVYWQNDNPNSDRPLPWRGIRYRFGDSGAWNKANLNARNNVFSQGGLELDARNFGENERCVRATFTHVLQCLYVQTVRDAPYDYGDGSFDNPLGLLSGSAASSGTDVVVNVSALDAAARGWVVRWFKTNDLVDGRFPLSGWPSFVVVGRSTTRHVVSGLDDDTAYSFQWRQVGVGDNREGGRWSDGTTDNALYPVDVGSPVAATLTASIDGLPGSVDENSAGRALTAVVGGTATGNISYRWSASIGRLSSTTSRTPTWTPPSSVSADTSATITLTVTRGGLTETATASVTVRDTTVRRTLLAEIQGLPASVNENAAAVSLTARVGGTATGNITYTWSASIGTLSSTSIRNPTWRPPANVASDTTATISLTVTRGGLNASDTDTVTVRDTTPADTFNVDITGLPSTVDEGSGGRTLGATLSGTATGNVTYTWSATLGSLSSTTARNPTWTPPNDVAANTRVTITLTATRANITDTDTATTTVRNVPDRTVTARITGLPAADASGVRAVDEGSAVRTLGVVRGGTAVGTPSYSWSVSSGGGTLSSETSATPRWTPPSDVSSDTTVTISVTVTVGTASTTASVNVTVRDTTPAPTLTADITGLPASVNEGTGANRLGVTLGGTATGTPTYVWTASIGSLSSTTSATPDWTPPTDVSANTTATIGVTVTRQGVTATDSARVTVVHLQPLNDLGVVTFSLSNVGTTVTVTRGALPTGATGAQYKWGTSASAAQTASWNTLGASSTFTTALGNRVYVFVRSTSTNPRYRNVSPTSAAKNLLVRQKVEAVSFSLAAGDANITVNRGIFPTNVNGWQRRHGTANPPGGTVTNLGSASSSQITGLTNNTVYYVSVRSHPVNFTQYDFSDWVTLSATPRAAAVPLGPLTATLSARRNAVRLARDTLPSGADGYQYQQATTSGGVAGAPINTVTSSFVDIAATGTVYARVRAHDSTGARLPGPWSGIYSATAQLVLGAIPAPYPRILQDTGLFLEVARLPANAGGWQAEYAQGGGNYGSTFTSRTTTLDIPDRIGSLRFRARAIPPSGSTRYLVGPWSADQTVTVVQERLPEITATFEHDGRRTFDVYRSALPAAADSWGLRWRENENDDWLFRYDIPRANERHRLTGIRVGDNWYFSIRAEHSGSGGSGYWEDSTWKNYLVRVRSS